MPKNRDVTHDEGPIFFDDPPRQLDVEALRRWVEEARALGLDRLVRIGERRIAILEKMDAGTAGSAPGRA